MDENSSFVFGLLAVQLKGLEPRQLIRACGGFPPESVSSLGSSLVERGLLDESDRCLLERLTEEIIAAHDGDSSAALVFWGGRQQISALFGSSLTPSALNEAVTLPLSGLPLAPDELDIVSEETPDRYTQITQYARGGMGRIFVVHDKLMARNVALKELLAPPEDGAQSPSQPRVGLVGRFLQEARLTGQLEHPAIVPVYELGRRINGAFYYTMKLVRGKTLLEALHARTQLVERLELLPHFLDLCQAIAYAHSRRIIHRDIKPANVMIGEFGETVVLDWGLAKAYGSPDVHAEEILQASASGQSASRTAYGKALGTPHYMPPEQAEGRIDAVDERSDVYSLGAVLYEILTGRPPFEGNTTQETIDRLLSEDLALVGTVEPAAPPELAGICQKALRKDPAQRYSSARELADEIIRYQSGALVQAYTYSFGRLLSRFYDRHRSAVRTAMAGVLAFLVLASYANVRLLQASQHEHAQRVAAEDAHRLAVEAQNHENEARHLAEQKAYSSQILLAQANILNENYAYANETLWQTQESRRGWEWGFLLNECNRDVLTIQATQYTPSRLIMEISPDDRFVFLMADTGPIKAWDLTTGSCVLTIDEKASANMDMAVGADQHRIVTAARDRPVTVWDTRTGLKTASFDQHMLVRRCAISGDGALAATVASNGSLQVWNCATGEEVAAMKVGMPARSMHFLDNDRLIVELIHDEVAVWEWSTGKRLVRVRGNLQAISADGRFFATAQGTSGGVWNAASGTRTCTLTDHTSDIVSLSFNSDGTRIITTTVDGTVQVSQVATGEPLLSFGSSRPLTDIVLSPSGKYVLGVSGKRVWIWDGETGEELASLQGHSGDILDVHFNSDETRIITASADKTIKIWDVDREISRRYITKHDSVAFKAAFSHDARYLATVARNSPIMIFDTETRAISAYGCYFWFGGHGVDLSPDGKHLVSGQDLCTPVIWDLQSHSVTAELHGHNAMINGCVYSPDGLHVATASRDTTARVWDASTGETVLILNGHSEALTHISYSPDGTHIVTASADKTARVWDANTGEAVLVLTGHTERVASAVYDPTGTKILTASSDRTARIWDASTGKTLVTLKGHSGNIRHAAFTPDGSRIITTSGDKTLTIWDPQTGEQYVMFAPDGAKIIFATFSPDGTQVITLAEDGCVRAIQAAPTSLQTLPGSEVSSWRERYTQYKTLLKAPAKTFQKDLADSRAKCNDSFS